MRYSELEKANKLAQSVQAKQTTTITNMKVRMEKLKAVTGEQLEEIETLKEELARTKRENKQAEKYPASVFKDQNDKPQ